MGEATGPSEILKAIALSALVIFTFTSNAFVLVVLFGKERRLLRKPLYLFICHLCMADILASVFTMTFEVSEELTHTWLYGEPLCKVISYIEMSLFGVNIFIHLSIAIERYVSVVHPLKPPIKLRTAKKLVVVSWCFPSTMALPYIYIRQVVPVNNGNKLCMAVSTGTVWLEKLFHTTELLAVFLLPLLGLSWMYIVIIRQLIRRSLQTNDIGQITSNSTRRAASHGSRLSIAVVLVFITCWTSFIIVFLVRLFTTTEEITRTDTLFVVALYSSFASELVSPILYCAFDRNIKPALIRVFCCRRRRNPLQDDSQSGFRPRETSRNETNGNRTENDVSRTPRHIDTTSNR